MPTTRDDAGAAELIERGVGLIAQGMFRMGDPSGGNDPKAAQEAGFAAVSVIRGMALDFMKVTARKSGGDANG